MQRPTGITILAIVYFLGGGISFVLSCLALAVGGGLRAADANTDDSSSVLALNLAFRGDSMFWVGLMGAGAALFKLSAATGLWMLKPWGRQLALIGGTLHLLTHLFGVIRGAITPAGVIGLLVNGGLLLYLSQYDVQRALADAPVDVPTTAR
jgi:uncharacterized membrane protein (DUF2068 family)